MPFSDDIKLDGEWSLVDGKNEHSLTMQVPGDVVTALQLAGNIPDPYHARNEYPTRWVGERDWTVSRTFTLQHTDYDLVLSELDTVVTVWLNGHCVLSAQNQFRRFRIDASQVLSVGENRLELRFTSPVSAAATRQQAQPWPVPWHQGNCPIPNGNMLRKVQCDFGWDWNIALAPIGLYGDCLLQSRQCARISTLVITQEHHYPDIASNARSAECAPTNVIVSVKCQIDFSDSEADKDVTLHLVFNDQTKTVIARQSGQFIVEFEVLQPKLWWPSGLGEQTLYPLEVTLGAQTEIRNIGLRRIELVTEPDNPKDDNATTESSGSSFAFRCNRKSVFMRGANWIPADALPGRIEPDKTRALLQSAVDANMNMLRVWGGGRYERDSFYAACDELGLLVWQDFMFSCNLYPSTDEFLQEVTAEVTDNVTRLHHHACLALWCGDNELIGALTWFPDSINNRDRYLVSYDRLNRVIEQALKSVCPQANWWPSSPSPGPMNFGDAWHDDRSGDMHFWSVWHEGRDFDHYRDVSPRFCSEFGFQSYPSLSVIRSFAGKADWNIASPVLESHQKNAGGNARIAETMFRYFRFPEGFENFVYLSQVQQGLAIKTAVTHWRGLKPLCMGTLYWQLNDTWPVASWSSLDYGGNWKLLHHMARKFYAPQLVTVVPTETAFQMRAVNDGVETVSMTLRVAAVTPTGHTRLLENSAGQVGIHLAETLLEIDRGVLNPDEMLLLQWQVDGQSDDWKTDVFAPDPWKSYALSATHLQSGLTVQSVDDEWMLTLKSDALALFVGLEADQAGHFSENGFFMLPGTTVDVRFTPDEYDTIDVIPRFVVRDLHQATCVST